VPWCKFFIPKIATPGVKQGDPDLNDHISYAKCIKGYVLRSPSDWVRCENLPAPDAKCWQEGGDTLFTLRARQGERAASLPDDYEEQDSTSATTGRTSTI
jgi:hypothetical protein